MKITQVNTRYVVQTQNGRMHILNRKSLIWNMKNVFGLTGEAGKKVMKELDAKGVVEVAA